MKYRWALQSLLRSYSEQEVAEFFLYPCFCPERVMSLAIDQKRRDRARARTEEKRSISRRRRRIWFLATVLVSTMVIAMISCAVTAGPGLGNGGWKRIRGRLSLALSKDFETLHRAAERLHDGGYAGILLMDSNGALNSFVSGPNEKNFLSHFNRWQALPKENEFLRERLQELQGTVDSGKAYLEIDLARDRLKVKMGTQSLYDFPIVSGKGRTYLPSLGRYRSFRTPRGVFRVRKKEKNPVWYKPNWVWHERGLKPPSRMSLRQRAVPGVLGKYKISLGDGYAIHGTRSGWIRPGKTSHGCIRMNAKDLEIVHRMVDVGTPVYIY
jgi:hypothetical protein